MPNSPITATTKLNPRMSSTGPKGEAELTADDVHTHCPEEKADQNEGKEF